MRGPPAERGSIPVPVQRRQFLSLTVPALLAACERGAGSTTTTTIAPNEATAMPSPPIAKRVPHPLVAHGHERDDPYYWLRERDDPEVLAYLEAENAYTEAMTASTAKLREELEAELAGRIVQDDSTVPVHDRGYHYYYRYEEGADYPLVCRRQGSLDAPEEIVLNQPELAVGHDYFAVETLAYSHSQQLLAYAVDTVGRRKYTLRFKDLRTGELLPDAIPEVTSNAVWAADDQTLFYTKQDPETLRAHQVYRHVLGTDPATDALVYEETDETFRVRIGRTTSRRFLVIHCSQTISDEVRILEADDPTGEFRVLQARERGLEYGVDHLGRHFYVRTNLEAQNFRLMRAPESKPGRAHWTELVPHRADVLLEGFDLFDDFLVLSERRRGLIELRVRPWAGGEEHTVDFGEPTYVAYTYGNLDPSARTLRFAYASMTTPSSVYDYDMQARTKVLRKQTEVLGGFDSANYVTERVWARARDGAEVPISLVYRKTTKLDGTAPTLVYAYGSYGSSSSAYFSSDTLSLLDRGFVYAIAHVRGGEELGRAWYEHGKLREKKNSFTDFIDCAEHLVAARYADPARVFAYGGSAGGLLIGAVLNMRPDLFNAAIAAVPFVDVVTTMLDDSIPLTTSEYDEWGNPNVEADYEYMLSYSPYDNVEAKDYPNLLVTTGLHDSQVQYWEPAKWVAKLRATKTDANLLLLKIDMSAGHGGKSGRLRRFEDTAFKWAFLLALT